MPRASAAPRLRSITRLRTWGPRSLIRTTTVRPVAWLRTQTREPNGSVGCAAVSARMSKRSPLAVRRRWNCAPYHEASPTSSAVASPRDDASTPGGGSGGGGGGSISMASPGTVRRWGASASASADSPWASAGAATRAHSNPTHTACLTSPCRAPRQAGSGRPPQPIRSPGGDRSPASRRFGSWCRSARRERPRCAAGRTGRSPHPGQRP